MEKKPLDRSVVAVLNALDMEQYIPLFEEYDITWELLIAFTEDDCRVVGIDDPEHIRQLVKHVVGYRSNLHRREEYVPPNMQEVLEVLQNSENQTRVMDVSTDYVNNTIPLKQCFDKSIGDGKSLTSAIQLLCDRVKCEKDGLIGDINRLIEEIEPEEKTESTTVPHTHGKFLGYFITGAVLSVSIAVLYKLFSH